MSPPRPASPEFGHVRAILAAFGLWMATSVAGLAGLPGPARALSVRVTHALFLAGRELLVGLVVALVAAAALRVGLRGWRGYVLLGGLALGIAAVTLGDELGNFAGTLLPAAPGVAAAGLVVAVAGAVVAAAGLGRWLARPGWRGVVVAAGLAVLLGHPRVLTAGYPGAHLFMAAAALAAIAGALVTAPRPVGLASPGPATPGLVIACGLFAVIVPPSNTLQVDMLRHSGDVVTPFLPQLLPFLRPSEEAVARALPRAWAPWFVARESMPAIAASAPRLPGPPVVLLVTVDSLRADLLTGEHDARLPRLAALRDASLNFREARAPGSQTVYTLAQMFMGRYFSQQRWSAYPPHRSLWLQADATPRFPELLGAAGIPTFHPATIAWLVDEFGVARGFREGSFVGGGHFTRDAAVLPRLLARLQRLEDGPLFAYVHLMDLHHSVRPAARGLPAYERYLANVERLDAALGELLAEIDRLGLASRCYVIVSSDHGEAFGEHGSVKHASTVYDELLRVPLLIKGPGVAPRTVSEPVTLMDLGPTILDIFGVATPGAMMGESLVGFMRGGDPKLGRPIAAEGRLKRALLFPDGVKAIVDDRHHTAEVYDLKADPGERVNLLDEDLRAAERIAAVRQFFAVHRRRAGGYVVPYRR